MMWKVHEEHDGGGGLGANGVGRSGWRTSTTLRDGCNKKYWSP